MIHQLPQLSYGYKDLEPYISEEIMFLHHQKHHMSYVNNLNSALEKYPDLQEKTAEELISNLSLIPNDIYETVRNNGGGHVNHSIFWQIMSPKAKEKPDGILANQIEQNFGGFEEFKNKFNQAGMKIFGSGWVWLVKNKSGLLEIMTTPNQDSPISEGKKPIIGNDVWEHAYYLQYKNMRIEYLKAWWAVLNWQEAENRFGE